MATTSQDSGRSSGSNSSSSAIAFFSIYDPHRYPAFDNSAFLADHADASSDGNGGASRVPYLQLHLPGADDNSRYSAAANPTTDDCLDDNLVLVDSAAAAAAAAAVEETPSGVGRGRWQAAAAAAAAAATERRPTLLRLAQLAIAQRGRDGVGGGGSGADISELLSRSLQRQRSDPVGQLADAEAGQLPGSSQQLARSSSVNKGPASEAWWRGAIADHLHSRAGHHYFNGQRDPTVQARASIRGSRMAYRRGPRPEVIGHQFDQRRHHRHQQAAEQKLQQQPRGRQASPGGSERQQFTRL